MLFPWGDGSGLVEKLTNAVVAVDSLKYFVTACFLWSSWRVIDCLIVSKYCAPAFISWLDAEAGTQFLDVYSFFLLYIVDRAGVGGWGEEMSPCNRTFFYVKQLLFQIECFPKEGIFYPVWASFNNDTKIKRKGNTWARLEGQKQPKIGDCLRCCHDLWHFCLKLCW